MLPPQAANKRIRLDGTGNNDGDVSEHESDDDVVNDELKQEFPTEEGPTTNSEWRKIWANKRLLKEILEYLQPKDVILKLFSNSKYFKNNKHVIEYISKYRLRYGYNLLRPTSFFKISKTNTTCTLAAKNCLIARFSVSMNEAEKNQIVREEFSKQYCKRGFSWSEDGVRLRPAKVQQLKQQVERWIVTNKNNSNVVLLNALSNLQGCRIGGA